MEAVPVSNTVVTPRLSGGLREQGKRKQQKPGEPLVTVVTVVYNRATDLQQTINSVRSQTYENIELIVVDGASTDGTLDLIIKNDNVLDVWISERDKGIYDAMNKGIALSGGAWINFMNCGDRFASVDVVKNFIDRKSRADIVYGDALVEHLSYNSLFPRQPLENMWRKSPFCHQATFINGELMRTWKYDLRYKIGADHDFFFRAYVNKKSFEYTGELVCLFDGRAGATKKNIVQGTRDLFDSTLSHQFRADRWVYSKLYLLYIRLLLLVKKLLGNQLTESINRMRRGNVPVPVAKGNKLV